jgi:hypothetical protein
MRAAREQQAFLRVYCIWYRKNERPKSAREFEERDGNSWIIRQVQVIEWETPQAMEVGMERDLE